jgi:hypothetical protein
MPDTPRPASRPTVPDDVPEADALDQADEVVPAPTPEPPRVGFEVPEADAWEQAQEIVSDPDEY